MSTLIIYFQDFNVVLEKAVVYNAAWFQRLRKIKFKTRKEPFPTDLSKAFDFISHYLPLAKLDARESDQKIATFISTSLNYRNQIAKVYSKFQ